MPVGAAAADARDQRDVGDEPVHGAEGRGPQRAAGDVAVGVVAVVLGELRRARKLGHAQSLDRRAGAGLLLNGPGRVATGGGAARLPA